MFRRERRKQTRVRGGIIIENEKHFEDGKRNLKRIKYDNFSTD